MSPTAKPNSDATTVVPPSTGPVKKNNDSNTTTTSPRRLIYGNNDATLINYTTPMTSKLDENAKCTGTVLSVHARACFLLLHHDDEVGLCKAKVSAREKNCSADQIKEQLHQLITEPSDAISRTGFAASFLPYEIRSVKKSEGKQQHCFVEPPTNPRAAVVPLTAENVNKLYEMVMIDGPNVPSPKEEELKDLATIVAWCSYFIGVQDDETLLNKLEDWCERNENTVLRKTTKEQRLAMGKEGLCIYVRDVLQELTNIRLSEVDHQKFVDSLYYAYSNDYQSFLSDVPICSDEDRETVRRNLDASQYGMLFFAFPPSGADSSIYTYRDLMLHRSVAYENQVRMDNAEPMAVPERVLYVTKSMSLFDEDVRPFENNGLGHVWMTKRLHKCIDKIFPPFVDKATVVDPIVTDGKQKMTEKGNFTKLLLQSHYVLSYHLMTTMSEEERKEYVERKLPIGFKKGFQTFLKDKCKAWSQKSREYRPEPGTINTACCFVCAYLAMLLVHVMNEKNQEAILPLVEHWKSQTAITNAEEGRAAMISLAVMLVEKYVIPMTAIINSLKSYCGFKKRKENRCQWTWHLRTALICGQLSFLYARQLDKCMGDFCLTQFCIRMARAIQKKAIRGTSKQEWKDKMSASGGSEESRIYPGATIQDFNVVFQCKNEASERKDVSWSEGLLLRQVAQLCYQQANNIAVREGIEEVAAVWFERLRYEMIDNSNDDVGGGNDDDDEDDDNNDDDHDKNDGDDSNKDKDQDGNAKKRSGENLHSQSPPSKKPTPATDAEEVKGNNDADNKKQPSGPSNPPSGPKNWASFRLSYTERQLCQFIYAFMQKEECTENFKSATQWWNRMHSEDRRMECLHKLAWEGKTNEEVDKTEIAAVMDRILTDIALWEAKEKQSKKGKEEEEEEKDEESNPEESNSTKKEIKHWIFEK